MGCDGIGVEIGDSVDYHAWLAGIRSITEIHQPSAAQECGWRHGRANCVIIFHATQLPSPSSTAASHCISVLYSIDSRALALSVHYG